MKRSLLLLLAAVLFLLTGCRVRTTALHPTDPSGSAAVISDGSVYGAGYGNEAAPADASMADGASRLGESDTATTENPDAARREYDANAAAMISDGAAHQLHQDGEGSGAPRSLVQEGLPVDQLSESGDRTATQPVPAAQAEQKGTGDDAPPADTYLTYYTVLLEERLGSLFECQRKDLYWENVEAYRTIHKTDAAHQWILQAGCYDVSARLLEENLTVDAGWVQRKNPGVIVKLVDKTVLGYGVADAGRAAQVCQTLMARPGWDGIDAVRSKRILLLSEQLLTSAHMRTAMLVCIAKTASPELFTDVDLHEALHALSQEAEGVPAEGCLIYTTSESN